LEKIVNVTVKPKGSIFNSTRQNMVYADDDIIGRSMKVINKVI
jgi:hypothetical protein